MSERKITGCGMLVLLLVLGPVLLWGGCRTRSWWETRSKLRAQAQQARDAFSPVIEKMRAAAAESRRAADYDLDQTVRIIHQLDIAMRERSSIQDYIHDMAAADYRGVAPEILVARVEILNVLMEMYGKQVELDQQAGLWELASEFILTTTSVVSVDLDAGSLVSLFTGDGSVLFNSDKAQAASLLDRLHRRQAEKRQTIRDYNQLQRQLVGTVMDYAGVYYAYLDAWDKLCGKRDRAYLAARELDWGRAKKAAAEAMAMEPDEKEAHLLYAMACLQEDFSFEAPRLETTITFLNDYIERHPGSSAPAYLLLGNAFRKQENVREATLLYKQAAAYYPKQAEELTDMLNPYRVRTFLRKTREGTAILEAYKSMMLGAGYFSPDLQLANLLFSLDDPEAATLKVMDHFHRRRNQRQWDFILSDIEFCTALMGENYRRIFPANFYLDLVADESSMSETRLRVGILNRAGRDLHNCSLILCINFTDMYEGDYETFTVGQTLAVMPAGRETDFGKMVIDKELLGRRRTLKDIITLRAILLSNEAVVWVDTPEYKIAEIVERATRAGTVRPDSVGVQPEAINPTRHASIGNDHLGIDLPASLAVLDPVFVLEENGRVAEPSQNTITGDWIRLLFKDVIPDQTGRGADNSPPINLKIKTRYGSVNLALTWGKDGGLTLRQAD